MAVITGKNSAIKIATTTILDMTDWSINISGEYAEATVFGTEWTKVGGQGLKSATFSMSGLINTADTTGQNILESAVISGTKLTTLRFYLDATNYWAPDTVTDTDAGAYCKTFNSTAVPNDMLKLTVDGIFTGPIHRTS